MIKLTFEEAEEAINKKKYVDSAFGREKLQLAIELMKADAMQRQAEAIERIAGNIDSCIEKISYSGKGCIRIKIEK